jgi:hypothetical protein
MQDFCLVHMARRTYVSTTTSTLSCATTTSPPSVEALLPLHRAPRLLASVRSSSTSTMLCAASTRLPAVVALLQLRSVSGFLDSSRGSSSTTPPMLRDRVPRHVVRLVVDYFAYVARPSASARRAARRRLHRLRRAIGCLGTSRGSSRSSSLTTSPTRCVRVPRHVTRLVVDFFAYAARPGGSARHAARCAARRRLLRLSRATGCLGTSRGSSRGSSSTTSPTPRVRVPPHHPARRRPLRLTQVRRRLLQLCHAFGCLGSSRGSSRRSSSTTSPTLCVQVPRHVA